MESKTATATFDGERSRDSFPTGKLSPGPGLPPRDVAAHQLARIHKATVGLVAEGGYQALKVRDLVRHAEVSTRAFYEHFGSKEDCFLQTYELISRRAARRIIAAQAGESEWQERIRLVFEEFARELEGEGARLAMIEAYAAGETSLAQAWRVERTFEGMLAEAFARAPDGVAVPPLIVEGLVAGIASISRGHLLSGETAALFDATDELVAWASSHVDPIASVLVDLDRQIVWRDTTLEPLPRSTADGEIQSWPSTGDRALILGAIADLVATHGYASLTPARVRSTAGVSRRKFDAHFDDLEDCFVAALEQHAGEAFAQAARAQGAAKSSAGGVYRAVAALCSHVTTDPFLGRMCLTDDFPTGADGIRCRQRLIAAVTELLTNRTHLASSPSLATEASTGAIWSLFHHYLIREWTRRQQIAATLSYMALTPEIGASDAVAAIQAEQEP